MQLSVPAESGGRLVPMAGLTWVGVHPDHRRRGVLTAMMRHHVEQTHREGVALSGLHASEPVIYGRYGYGLASQSATLSVGRGTTFNAPGLDDAAAAIETRLVGRHRSRPGRPGDGLRGARRRGPARGGRRCGELLQGRAARDAAGAARQGAAADALRRPRRRRRRARRVPAYAQVGAAPPPGHARGLRPGRRCRGPAGDAAPPGRLRPDGHRQAAGDGDRRPAVAVARAAVGDRGDPGRQPLAARRRPRGRAAAPLLRRGVRRGRRPGRPAGALAGGPVADRGRRRRGPGRADRGRSPTPRCRSPRSGRPTSAGPTWWRCSAPGCCPRSGRVRSPSCGGRSAPTCRPRPRSGSDGGRARLAGAGAGLRRRGAGRGRRGRGGPGLPRAGRGRAGTARRGRTVVDVRLAEGSPRRTGGATAGEGPGVRVGDRRAVAGGPPRLGGLVPRVLGGRQRPRAAAGSSASWCRRRPADARAGRARAAQGPREVVPVVATGKSRVVARLEGDPHPSPARKPATSSSAGPDWSLSEWRQKPCCTPG